MLYCMTCFVLCIREAWFFVCMCMKRNVLNQAMKQLSYLCRFAFYASCMGILLLLAACGPSVSAPKVQKTVVVNPSFQAQTTPIPTVPPYRCGAWASNNAPGAYSTITIYARLTTKDAAGVAGATAKAVVHFKDTDQQIDQQPTSDAGGYVSFPLSLQGRQPRLLPATVDVTFTIAGKDVNCSQAFFTPQ